ncbi:GAF domain-containing protein [Sphingobium sufflavum]|uniref:HWE histidine kinase domain-containing protein n=1 Tax=Sphingobium sufflavum TaxID=1129547 RepID=UPI001F3FE6D0|nr:HWE histidine kinase domain-containing protein [Sphingobium sufflavum]MCE7797329.1 GAF domain-containing protein [Sphingobium sufflavum]
MSDAQGPAVDLTNCDREPIHQLGAIQPFGFLLALTSDWTVARASANIGQFLGMDADDAIGLTSDKLLTEDAIHLLRNRMMMLRGPDAVERMFSVPLSLSQPDNLFDCAIHFSGGVLVLEAEPQVPNRSMDPGNLVRAFLSRLDATETMAKFFDEGARQIRALTGFDRVMVYRFGRDGAGEVVGETVRPGLGRFLGLNYPASDIPVQARALYVRTPFRIIADIGAEPVPVIPARNEKDEPLDLSLSILRSVSPIHIEYLKNMGVGASLSVSILVNGKLWGLFACHHYKPCLPSFEQRTLAELSGQMFALKLESREHRDLADYDVRARAAGDRLLAALAGDMAILNDVDWVAETLGEIVPCDGVAVMMNGAVATSGYTPPSLAIHPIVRRLSAMEGNAVSATDHLSAIIPGADAYADDAAGLLAIPISRKPRDYVLLFRRQRLRSVTWAGDPHKPASYGPNGIRLTPRASFDAWSQEVSGHSAPFTQAEVRVAETLRSSLVQVVLRLSEDAQEDKRRASERQELLIAELNHRVRNILALIRGVARQSKDGTEASTKFLAMFEGRVHALARAHDQITRDNWAPALLRPLIETEADAYIGKQTARLDLSGPAVLLEPNAFSTLALVIHEMMTNSAKYGALVDSGRLIIRWAVNEAGDLLIDWREQGGPAVQAPKREGFGTTIITKSIPHDLGGDADVRYKLAGLEAQFRIPARHVRLADPSHIPEQPVIAVHTNLAARSEMLAGLVLLVEDSLIIAMDAEDMIRELGATRIAVASNTAQALAEIEREQPTLAILDVNLGEETSLPIAEALAQRGVPFLFATGYGEQLDLPNHFVHVPVAQKPYDSHDLSALLTTLSTAD